MVWLAIIIWIVMLGLVSHGLLPRPVERASDQRQQQVAV